MIDALISSKTRIKLLLKFFLNSETSSYLRGLESEFGESSNSIRLELNRFEKAGMLKSHLQGNKKYFQANTQHPLYNEVHNILLKHLGFDKIIENVITRLGAVEKVYVGGDLAKGVDSKIIDLILIGDIQTSYLVELIAKVENLIHRKIRFLVYKNKEEVDKEADVLEHTLLLWSHE